MLKLLSALFLFISISLSAQCVGRATSVQASAKWIEAPTVSPTGCGVSYFRKSFKLNAKTDTCIIRYTSDSHVKLYVNGAWVSVNALSTDSSHYSYNQLNIASWLNSGENTIVAIVWNNQSLCPSSYSKYLGFYLQGISPTANMLNTNSSWRCSINRSSTQLPSDVGFTHFCGVGEKVDLGLASSSVFNSNFDDSSWFAAHEIDTAFFTSFPKKDFLANTANEIKPQRLAAIRKAVGIKTVPPRYPASAASILIPANTEVKLLFDQNFVTTAFPSLTLSAGKGATIKLKYAESLYVDDPQLHGAEAQKGNRNEFDAKFFLGFNDEITTDGNPNQTWTSLSFRTFRYIQMTVITRDEPLILNEFMAYATGFPYVQKATFTCNNADLLPILSAGWHTLRACSHQTFYGSPYYEQVTNLNAARVLSLAALFNTADSRLTQNVLVQTAQKQTTEGYLDLRLPAQQNQIDISQSLAWLGMLYDLYPYSSDSAFVISMLPTARRINSYFQTHLLSGKSLPGCNFADNAKEWKNGVAPSDSLGRSAFFEMYYLYIVRQYITLEKQCGDASLSAVYEQFANQLETSIRGKYWNATRGLFANESAQKTFSQQVNTLAILAGLNSDSTFMRKILNDKELVQNSIYFKFFENQALVKVGLAKDYLNHLEAWQNQLKQGLTTWAEQPEPTRSDCFGWGVSPNIEFYRTVLGVNAASPWFKTVCIKPYIGNLKNVSGKVSHYKGDISVSYQYIKKKKRWDIEVALPKGLKGEFVWKDKSYALPDSTSKWSYKEADGGLSEYVGK